MSGVLFNDNVDGAGGEQGRRASAKDARRSSSALRSSGSCPVLVGFLARGQGTGGLRPSGGGVRGQSIPFWEKGICAAFGAAYS